MAAQKEDYCNKTLPLSVSTSHTFSGPSRNPPPYVYDCCFGGLASIIGLTLGGFLHNSVGGVTFLISGGVIFVVFIMSFRLLKLN